MNDGFDRGVLKNGLVWWVHYDPLISAASAQPVFEIFRRLGSSFLLRLSIDIVDEVRA